ncbi:proline-rich protein 36-like [Penaeus monodon]|uniref:proline-rich protein 36-like n=1 Tax=Penaeus monodon TaxID=6687 RepID=UPI0018A7D82C|nr:proline-rich protein 36-like [Penaeus monodon]
MQSGEAVSHEEQMTLSPSPAPAATSVSATSLASLPTLSPSLASSPPVSSPSIASSPPITSPVSPTSLSSLRTTSSAALLHLEKQASLANKLRLSKILGNHAATPPFDVRSSLIGDDDDDGRSDIRVLSPSLVNSQVLSKTRPLSPDPPDPPGTHLPNGEGLGGAETERRQNTGKTDEDGEKTTKGRGR